MSKREIPIDDSKTSGTGGDESAEAAASESGMEGGLEERLSALEQENQRLRDQAIRAVADLDNYRRRAMQEREQLVQYANERLLRSVLPIVDDFQRSVDSGAQSKDFESFYQGVSMIYGKLQKILDAQGVKKIETSVGEPFNVDLHEALMRQPSDAPEDTVISELEPGYTYGEKVLRHAKVIVSAGS
jgi:molecular chaperone GrpE